MLSSAAALATRAEGASEVRVAFIGVGGRGTGLLKQVLMQPGVKVAGICDVDATARDRALSSAGRDNPRGFTEWRQVLQTKDVDAVIIATPCDLHAQMATAALEAGKYVYCEKPLAITLEQVELVLRAASRSKAFLQIGLQLRYFPAMREAIRQIQHENLLGRVYVIKAQRHSGRRPAGGSGGSSRIPSWYADVKRSGDQIVENAIHNIDACNWIADSRPVSGYGHGKKYFPKPVPAGTIMMDGFSVEYIYENDVHLDYSQLGFHPRKMTQLPSGMWYAVFGEKGSLFLTHFSATFYDVEGTAEPRDILPQTVKDRIEELKRNGSPEGESAMTEFYTCIREKRSPSADIKVAAVAALTTIMGREAIYKGRSVTWKELGVTV